MGKDRSLFDWAIVAFSKGYAGFVVGTLVFISLGSILIAHANVSEAAFQDSLLQIVTLQLVLATLILTLADKSFSPRSGFLFLLSAIFMIMFNGASNAAIHNPSPIWNYLANGLSTLSILMTSVAIGMITVAASKKILSFKSN